MYAQVICFSHPSDNILVCFLMIWLIKVISEESALTTLIFSFFKLRIKYPPLEGAKGFTLNRN